MEGVLREVLWRRLTLVAQVFAEFHVAVASGCDVEVALDFVSFYAAEDSARVGWHAAPHLWSLSKLSPSFPDLS